MFCTKKESEKESEIGMWGIITIILTIIIFFSTITVLAFSQAEKDKNEELYTYLIDYSINGSGIDNIEDLKYASSIIDNNICGTLNIIVNTFYGKQQVLNKNELSEKEFRKIETAYCEDNNNKCFKKSIKWRIQDKIKYLETHEIQEQLNEIKDK